MTAPDRACAGCTAEGRVIGGVDGPAARFPLLQTLLVLALAVSANPPRSHAYTPDSPEVVAMVDKALAYLEQNNDDRLGGKCLVALAFLKRGLPANHPRVVEAIDACRTSVDYERPNVYVYSKALAIIFLTELDADAHSSLIQNYIAMLPDHQHEHGGFGYSNMPTGDTSQTQYAALAYWQMMNHGISPDARSVQECLKWLLRTQDPAGTWGYQGEDPGSYALVKQVDRPGRSMGAAGMGSTLILGNVVGLLQAPKHANASGSPSGNGLPPALKRLDQGSSARRAETLPAGDVPRQQLDACLERARGWWAQNNGLEDDSFQYYFLYSMERLKSFESFLGEPEAPEPDWYNAGVELLLKNQSPAGSWTDGCGEPCATAFATLFLLRSTQQSIRASLGEGTLVGGRGLPRDLSKVRLKGGRLVVQHNPTELDQLLELMEADDADELDALIGSPAALEVGSVTEDDARRLQQIVRSGSPRMRLLAVRALAKARKLDYAPTLIYALTDPDRQVVREARDGLRLVSRNFEGLGPPDNFNDDQRDQASVRWKAWYATVRPDAPPLP
jgi:hypothetical protein